MTDLVKRLLAISLMDLRTGGFLAHTMDTALEAARALEAKDREIWKVNIQLEAQRDMLKDAVARIDAAESQLATVRHDALEEAAQVAEATGESKESRAAETMRRDTYLLREAEAFVAIEIASAIRALQSSPASPIADRGSEVSDAEKGEDNRLTSEELTGIFGPTMPWEAVTLLWGAAKEKDNRSIDQVRAELKAIAAKKTTEPTGEQINAAHRAVATHYPGCNPDECELRRVDTNRMCACCQHGYDAIVAALALSSLPSNGSSDDRTDVSAERSPIVNQSSPPPAKGVTEEEIARAFCGGPGCDLDKIGCSFECSIGNRSWLFRGAANVFRLTQEKGGV